MTIKVRDGTNTVRTLTGIQVRDGTNTPRTLNAIRVRDSNNVSRLIYSTGSTLSASADPTFVGGSTYGTGAATTNTTTVTASGGTAPYTYAWTLISYDNPTPPTIDSPSSATSSFTQTSIPPATAFTATFRCTVTDDDGATASVDLSAFWIDTSGPL